MSNDTDRPFGFDPAVFEALQDDDRRKAFTDAVRAAADTADEFADQLRRVARALAPHGWETADDLGAMSIEANEQRARGRSEDGA